MDTFWNNGRCVQLNHKRWDDFVDKSVPYFDITSTTFGTGTQNVRCIDFPSSVYFSPPGK